MKQYCRYCANAVQIEEDWAYCEESGRMISKSSCAAPNKCKRFLFNKLDVFNIEHTYMPRGEKADNRVSLGEQISMEEL